MSSSRIFVVGDIHGCAHCFFSLLNKVSFSLSSDYLWCVGDFLNRGVNSLDVIRELMSYGDRAVVVLGNHDLYALALLSGVHVPHYQNTFGELKQFAQKQNLIDWLRTRPILFQQDEYVVVHAGILPSWTISEASKRAFLLSRALSGSSFRELLSFFYKKGSFCLSQKEDMSEEESLALSLNVFLRMRFCSENGLSMIESGGNWNPWEKKKGCGRWFDIPRKEKLIKKKVLFGHWSRLGLYFSQNYICLDSGCSWGQRLTMLELSSMQIHSVDCFGSKDLG